MDAAKMSKSKGNVVLRAHRQYARHGRAPLFPSSRLVFGQDGNFSYDALVTRYNSDLANGLGNLASRTAALIEKSFAGKIPTAGALKPQDEAIAKKRRTPSAKSLKISRSSVSPAPSRPSGP